MSESIIERANKQAYRTAGKGDAPRPVNKSVWNRNYNRIFRPKRLNKWSDPDKGFSAGIIPSSNIEANETNP